MRWLICLSILFLNGCMGKNLGEVRATTPVQTGTFPALYEQLAACAKHDIELESWLLGQPAVYLTRESRTPLVRVFAIYAGSTLFELTFQPAPSGKTLVKYRRGYDGYESKEKAWSILERCSQQTPALSTPVSDIPPPSSGSPTPSPTAP
jgi:hypothetical protein